MKSNQNFYAPTLNQDEERARDMFAAAALTATMIKGWDHGKLAELVYDLAEQMIIERRERQQARLIEATKRYNELCEELEWQGKSREELKK